MPEDKIVSKLEDVILELQVSNKELDKIDSRIIESSISIQDSLDSGINKIVTPLAEINFSLPTLFANLINALSSKKIFSFGRRSIGIGGEAVANTTTFVKTFSENFTSSFSKIKDVIVKPFMSIRESVTSTFSSLKEKLIAPFVAVKESFAKRVDSVKNAFARIGKGFGNIGKGIGGFFGKLFGRKSEDIKIQLLTSLNENTEKMIDLLSGIKLEIKSLISEIIGNKLEEVENRREQITIFKNIETSLTSRSADEPSTETRQREKSNEKSGGIFKSIGKGLSSIGKLASLAIKIVVGGLALVALAGALYIAAKAFQQFADIDWKSLLIGIGAIGLLAVVAGVIGAFAPIIILGAIAIAILGAALIPAAYAFEIFGKAAGLFADAFSVISGAAGDFISTVGETIVNVISGIADSIERLTNLDSDNMTAAAKGIGALAVAVGGFGVGGFVAGVLDFFSADPVKKFERFAQISGGLKVAAESLKMLKESLKDFTSDGLESMAKGLNKIFNVIDDYKKLIKDGYLEQVVRAMVDMNEVFVKPLQPSIEPSGVIAPMSAVDGTNIYRGSIQNEQMKEEQRSAAMMNAIMPITSSINNISSPNSTNVSNVTYNKSTHLDDTMINSVFANAF